MTDTQHLWTIADICAATNGQTNDQAAATKTDGMITGISIDSREMKAGDLFVALPGTVADGHKFLAAAQSAGASAALVSKIDRQWYFLNVLGVSTYPKCLQNRRKTKNSCESAAVQRPCRHRNRISSLAKVPSPPIQYIFANTCAKSGHPVPLGGSTYPKCIQNQWKTTDSHEFAAIQRPCRQRNCRTY